MSLRRSKRSIEEGGGGEGDGGGGGEEEDDYVKTGSDKGSAKLQSSPHETITVSV